VPFVRANGIDIAYARSGDPRGRPILLIMGLGMQLTAWPDEFIDGLGELGFDVIRFDNRDCGLSTAFDDAGTPSRIWTWVKAAVGLPVRSAYTLEDMADDAAGLLAALGVTRAHVVGVSMGGMIGQILAVRHPERVLTLTSIMSSSGRRHLPRATAKARAALLRQPKGTDRSALVEYLVDLFRTIGSPAYPTPERQLRERIARSLDRGVNMDGVLRQLVAIVANGDRSRVLRAIRAPTLVIHGAADPLLPPACGEDTARLIPGARFELIEGLGHDLPPALIERFLALIDAHTHGKMAPDPIARLFERQ